MDYFFKNLQYLLQEKNVDLNSISKSTRISIKKLSNYMSGEIYPSIQDINILSAYFNVSADEIISFDYTNMLGKTVDIKNVISFDEFNLKYDKITNNYKKDVRVFTLLLMIPPLSQQIFTFFNFIYPHYLVKYIVILYLILFMIFIYDINSNFNVNVELKSKNISNKRVLMNVNNELYFKKVFQSVLYVLLGIAIFLTTARYFSMFIYLGAAVLIFSIGITSEFLININREISKK